MLLSAAPLVLLLLIFTFFSRPCVGKTPTNPLFWGREPCSSSNVPASSHMKGTNGIYWGWNPDVEKGVTISEINSATGKKASTVGLFSQISSPNGFDGHQLLNHLDEVKASGATLIASVMPNGLSFSEVTPAIASDVASVVKQFTNQGIEVWLRFAHEMNWYVRAGTYKGNSTQFKTAWRNIHAATKDITGCLLFWSPNNAKTLDLYEEWWPGPAYVDIVGMDLYVNTETSTFKTIYGGFYDAYAKGHNKHFAVPETATKPDNEALKQAWVSALASKNVAAYPCFKSVTWFELHKSWDYRVVMSRGEAAKEATMANFV